ncbi:MAG: TPM domain-containing protein [Bacteroidetes bacterium]|nr:TPM domain-containing protein [Bacteroidota bacterium]
MFILSETQQTKVIEAIKDAETNTSGEIKVHIESNCKHESPMERAGQIFEYLHLHKTANRNGVLFYLAYEDRKFAVLGDKGINDKVGADFWNSTVGLLRDYFKKGDFENGLIAGIKEAGIKLREFFPYQSTDKNEISDDLSIGH